VTDDDEPDGPWFVATDVDETDGWHFTPPDGVREVLRRLVDGDDEGRPPALGVAITAVARLWHPPIDDAVLTEVADRILDAFEEPIWAEHGEGRGRAALLAAVFEEANGAVLRRVRRTRRGGYRLRFGVVDRLLLGRALDRLDDLLGSDDPSLARLFPNPYPDDAARAEGWKAMVTDELIEKRREGLTAVRAMMGRSTATEEEVLQLMRTVNDTRLMLGTLLDVSEDEPARRSSQDPDALLAQAYDYLGYLLSSILAALR
jgi:hypothetical protein